MRVSEGNRLTIETRIGTLPVDVATYEKACDCKSTSTTRQFRFRRIESNDPAKMEYMISYEPGPSCDACGKDWVRR